jgi:hypothetical protein
MTDGLTVDEAAARMHDLRIEIADALSEIPVLLSKTRIALDVFKASDELRQCSVELYIATLAALQHILEWYNEKAGSMTPN